MQESEEFQEELVYRWDEVHKKSMVTLLIMLALVERNMWSKELEEWLKRVADWELNERSLHRTLKRMAGLGLIRYEEVNAAKTGANRKVYMLTGGGRLFLKEIRHSSLSYLSSKDFSSNLDKA